MEYRPLASLKKHPKNPRTIKDDSFRKLVDSIDANPDYFEARPIILSDRTGDLIIIAGNQRYAAAKEIGIKDVPTVLIPALTEKKEQEIMIRDNISNGDWDFDMLAADWDAGLLNDWGLDVPDWDQAESFQGNTDPDDVPEPEPEPVTQLGDLWLLGEHRLLCGNSTSESDLNRLISKNKIDLVFSDPPYGIEIVSTSQSKVGGGGPLKFAGTVGASNIVDAKKYAQIIGDDSTDTAKEFYQSCLNIGVENFIIWGGNYFTDFVTPSMCWIVWDKQNSGNFADVELAWTSYKKAAKLYSFMWNGLARSGNRKDELASRVHPTQKPVGLFEQIFKDFDFNICLDGFLGSGSTLIACEKTNRKCYGLELSPQYCDVIVKRWQDYTGKEATLEGTGETFAEVKESRLGAAV